MIPNSKKIKKNIGFVKKILSKPSPIKIPTTIGEIRSKPIFIPIPRPFGSGFFFKSILFNIFKSIFEFF